MPLEIFARGRTWWARGRLEASGQYVRRSLGTSDQAVALAKVREIEKADWERAVLGDSAPGKRERLTFAGAVLETHAKPAEARYLAKLVPVIGNEFIKDISARRLKEVARTMYPDASTDTWQRQVITPARSVINQMHERGLAEFLHVKAYTKAERIAQDRKRGKLSRQEKTPGSWPWLEAFMAAARRKRNPYIEALAHFIFVTGARIGQATDLVPDDLDLQRGRVLMPPAKGFEAKWVSIPTDLVVKLANLPPRGGKVFGYASRHSVYGAWNTVCAVAGIDGTIKPHAAGRHGFATELMVRQGLDPVTVAKAGRWASPRMLLDTYGHSEDAEDRAREALEKGRHRTNPVHGKSGSGSK